MFEASDLPKVISWREFLKKGYYVVPAPDANVPRPRAFNWFYEGRKKDVPEPHPLPGEYRDQWLEGLQTQSGKLEFVPETLKKFDDPERPAVNRYIPSWEGTQSAELLSKYPIQLLTAHTRYSFHSLGDGKDSIVNDIKQHRMLIDGYYYLICRIAVADAERLGIKTGDLIRLFNDRGEVICAAEVSRRLRTGVAHTYESSAVYDSTGHPGKSPERGGCVNLLTPARSQTLKSSSMAPNACLIQMERWVPPRGQATRRQMPAERVPA